MSQAEAQGTAFGEAQGAAEAGVVEGAEETPASPEEGAAPPKKEENQ